MTVATDFVLQGSTHTLVTYPPRVARTPVASPTIAVWTRNQSLQTTPDNADVSAVSETTIAAAPRGSKVLTFAQDPACVPGRRYVISHASLPPFQVEVITSGLTTYLATGLPVEVPTGALIVGTDVSHPLTADETATVGHAKAHFVATQDGAAVEWEQHFYIAPRNFTDRLTVPDLWTLAPEFKRTQSDALNPQQEIDAEYLRLFAELEGRGYEIEKVRTWDPLKLAVVDGLRYQRSLALHGAAAEDTLEAKRTWREAISTADNRTRFWYAADVTDSSDGTIPTTPQGVRPQDQLRLER